MREGGTEEEENIPLSKCSQMSHQPSRPIPEELDFLPYQTGHNWKRKYNINTYKHTYMCVCVISAANWYSTCTVGLTLKKEKKKKIRLIKHKKFSPMFTSIFCQKEYQRIVTYSYV